MNIKRGGDNLAHHKLIDLRGFADLLLVAEQV